MFYCNWFIIHSGGLSVDHTLMMIYVNSQLSRKCVCGGGRGECVCVCCGGRGEWVCVWVYGWVGVVCLCLWVYGRVNACMCGQVLVCILQFISHHLSEHACCIVIDLECTQVTRLLLIHRWWYVSTDNYHCSVCVCVSGCGSACVCEGVYVYVLLHRSIIVQYASASTQFSFHWVRMMTKWTKTSYPT